MASPPKDSGRRSFRKSLRQGFDRFTHAVLPSSRPPSRGSGTSAPSGSGARSVSPAPSATPTQSVVTQPTPPQETGTTEQLPAPSTLGVNTSASLALPTVNIIPPSPGPTAIDKLKEAGGVALSGLETALRALEKSSDVFPPLKLALGGFVDCLDIIQTATANAEEYESLTLELTTMAGTLNRYLSEIGSGESSGSATRIALSIQTEVAHIDKQQGHGKGRRVLESAQDKEDVIKRYHRIESLFRQLQGDIMLRIWQNSNEQQVTTLLRGMSPVDDARYNSDYSTTIKRRACTPETRQRVQADLQDWVRDPDAAKVYWMNGMAGTGKTTIAYSLCEWLKANQRLGASFFCSRVSSSCRNVNNIIRTIAYQLARYSPAFQSELCKVLKEDPDASKVNVVQQFEKLVREPLMGCRDGMPEGVVVVVDALDECEDDYGVRLVLGTLLKLGKNLPVKFFVTSRPEPAIRDNMLSPGGYSTAVLHLHDIEQSIVEEDIKKYLKEALSIMSPPPSDEQIEQLAKYAGKLFIYAATAVRYILPGKGPANPSSRLHAMLAAISQMPKTEQSSNKYKELDELYTSILRASFNGEEDEIRAMRRVLWTAVCAKEPMTIPTMASLLDLTEEQASYALQPLRSVLHVSEPSGLVSTLHASFPDYMLDRLRSGEFCCDRAQHGEFLAHRCFDVMKDQLRFNVCGLESSFVYDKDVPGLEQRIKTHISPTLFYACRYWGDHLRLAGALDELRDKLVDFLTNRLLFWMEVLNLRSCVVKGISILVHAESWLSNTKPPADVQKQASDARDFVTRFAGGACVRSTPHIYLSALPFCARSSSVYTHYWRRTRGLMNVNGTAISRRDKAAQATWMIGSAVDSVALSPDGARIVSGSRDNTIRVWDADTGDIIAGPFQGHTDDVNSVAFSPDGTRIVSGSGDGTIRVWDAHTGDTVAGPFKGHTDQVYSVEFSPDGSRIASGSGDSTIRVWDVHTGDTVTGPFEGHRDQVNSVAFSPDGTRIISGSGDKTIRVWDAHTGDTVAGPFEGHIGSVNSVAFSPDGTCIVSGSDDKTIQVWDARTGNAVAGPFEGHTKAVQSVVFSPDGTRIVSGSSDYTVRLWDQYTSNSNVTTTVFKGHTNQVKSVVFSPDGVRIFSSSFDNTIQVWHAQTGDSAAGIFQGHADPIYSVALSLDGTLIASGSYDGTIRVWDAHTSYMVAGPFEGHADWVRSVAFSPDSTLIVSGSDDATIRVWDAHTGSTIAGPFEGHTNWVKSVAFSPDGTRIVSGSYDGTIRVWGANTGDTVAGPFEGHKYQVNSVAFSPDDTRIISGSGDKTIRVWDAHTGDTVTGPFEGHKDRVNSVAFSPDGTRIISGSSDETIRVWDAHTGNTVAGPFEGHKGSVNSVAFSPDGTSIVSGSSDSTVRLWNSHTGNVIAGPFQGHTHRVNSVLFSPDGTYVVSCSDDETIRAWDMRADHTAAELLIAHNDSAGSATVPLDGICAASSTNNGQHAYPPNAPVIPMSNAASLNHVRETFTGIGNFTANNDGWVTAGDDHVVPLFWVSPDLCRHVPSPHNTYVIGPQGSMSIDYRNLALDERWSECYTVR